MEETELTSFERRGGGLPLLRSPHRPRRNPSSASGTQIPERAATGSGARLIRQLGTFGLIGVVSTLAYVAIYSILRAAWPAAVANAVALVLTAVGNTAANRRLTFDVRGREGLARDQASGLLAFLAALAITTVSLAALGRLAPNAGRGAELTVLVAANAVATLVRFLLLRLALDRSRPVPTPVMLSIETEGIIR